MMPEEEEEVGKLRKHLDRTINVWKETLRMKANVT